MQCEFAAYHWDNHTLPIASNPWDRKRSNTTCRGKPTTFAYSPCIASTSRAPIPCIAYPPAFPSHSMEAMQPSISPSVRCRKRTEVLATPVFSTTVSPTVRDNATPDTTSWVRPESKPSISAACSRFAGLNSTLPPPASKVAPEVSGRRFQRIGCSHHVPHHGHRRESLNNHGQDRTGSDEVHQIREERLVFMLLIVTFRQIAAHLQKSTTLKGQASLLEAGDDLTDQSKLNTIRFHQHQGTLHRHTQPPVASSIIVAQHGLIAKDGLSKRNQLMLFRQPLPAQQDQFSALSRS